jgi:hypothetical protein
MFDYLLHLLTAGVVAVAPYFQTVSRTSKVHSQDPGISSLTNAGNLVELSYLIVNTRTKIPSAQLIPDNFHYFLENTY